MGSSSSKQPHKDVVDEAKQSEEEEDPLAGASIDTLADKEVVATMQFMLEHSRCAQEDATTETMSGSAEFADNSAFDYAFTPTPLPRDADGYVQAFEPDAEDDIRAFFDKYGVVVVKCLSPEESRRTQTEIWDFLERHTSVKRNRPETYHHWPSLSKVGILGNTIILSPQACENRQHPNVYAAFRALFQTEKLRVAVMRASVMRPTRNVRFPKAPEHVSDGSSGAGAGAGGDGGGDGAGPRKGEGGDPEYDVKDMPDWRSAASWLHWDMVPFTGATTTYAWKRTSIAANLGYDQLKVQGVLAAVDCNDRTGGFVCVPGIHRHVRGWAHLNQDKHGDSVRGTTVSVPKDDPMLEHAERVHVRAGHLIIWDSHLAHANFPNDGGEDDMRFVQYIKMAPITDTSVEPVFTKRELLPDGFTPTGLGEKLLGFTAWDA